MYIINLFNNKNIYNITTPLKKLFDKNYALNICDNKIINDYEQLKRKEYNFDEIDYKYVCEKLKLQEKFNDFILEEDKIYQLEYKLENNYLSGNNSTFSSFNISLVSTPLIFSNKNSGSLSKLITPISTPVSTPISTPVSTPINLSDNEEYFFDKTENTFSF